MRFGRDSREDGKTGKGYGDESNDGPTNSAGDARITKHRNRHRPTIRESNNLRRRAHTCDSRRIHYFPIRAYQQPPGPERQPYENQSGTNTESSIPGLA